MQVPSSLTACVADFFLIVALVLGIFSHLGQITPRQVVPRTTSILKFNTTGLARGLAAATNLSETQLEAIYGDRSQNYVYGTHVNGTGVRYFYEYGIWGTCATYNKPGNAHKSWCEKPHFGNMISPIYDLYYDAPSAYQPLLLKVLPEDTLKSNREHHYARLTQAGMYLWFIGCILLAITILTTFVHFQVTLYLSALVCSVTFVVFLVGNILYTVTLQHQKSIWNHKSVNGTPLGVTVSNGNDIPLMWTTMSCIFVAIPLLVLAGFLKRPEYETRDDFVRGYGQSEDEGIIMPDYSYNNDKNFWEP